MADIKKILSDIDGLLRESKLDDAIAYMNSTLQKAYAEKDNETALTMLNEMAGFYRDTGKMKDAIECCMQSEKLMDDMGIGDTKERAAAYLNTSNAYRADKNLDKAFEYFEKAEKVLRICGDEILWSSYYNNIALCYQEAGKFEEAIKNLKEALIIADDKLNDEIKVAISRTNLAASLIRVRRIDEAKDYLMPAIKTFKGRTPSDFHYSAALSALGDITLAEGKVEEAVEYFEQAVSEIKLHMGENNFYQIVSDNLKKIYETVAKKKKYKGLELSEKYFEAFGRAVIERNFQNLKKHIACAMVGEGSECLGFDDDISADHDFGPGFCIFVDDSVDEKDFERLRKAYDNLPKTYRGYTRLETAQGKNRVGVIRFTDYIKKVTGFDHMPKGIEEWQYTVDENLAIGVNGKVFLDEGNILSDFRKRILHEQPYYVYFRKLGMQLELMAKHGQYSFPRAVQRGDMGAAFIAKAEFLRSAMRAAHILNHKYAPYSKWLRKSMEGIEEFKELLPVFDKLFAGAICKEDIDDIEKISAAIHKAMKNRGLITNDESYLAVSAYEIGELADRTVIADRIVDAEWAMFDNTNNEGGRANCQDDWGTFSIMRRSQYYLWPMQLLQLLYSYYADGMQKGRNFITEKYGYMMESTAPEEFAKIKDKLPVVDEEKKKMMESIIQIQVGWMESFAEKYPKLSRNTRVIHTSEDTPFITSYETYLRGELSTYHMDILAQYGHFIVDIFNKKDNLALKTMNMTTFMYGFASLDDAQKKQG